MHAFEIVVLKGAVMGFHSALIRRVKSVINTWLKDAYRLSYV